MLRWYERLAIIAIALVVVVVVAFVAAKMLFWTLHW